MKSGTRIYTHLEEFEDLYLSQIPAEEVALAEDILKVKGMRLGH